MFLSLRTTARNGLIFYVSLSNSGFVALEMVEGRINLVYSSDISEQVSVESILPTSIAKINPKRSLLPKHLPRSTATVFAMKTKNNFFVFFTSWFVLRSSLLPSFKFWPIIVGHGSSHWNNAVIKLKRLVWWKILK